MKTTTVLLLVLFCSPAIGQRSQIENQAVAPPPAKSAMRGSVDTPADKKNNRQDFERKLYVELNERTSFYEVNDHYQLLKDTIYHANSGFKVLPDYDIITVDTVKYVILRYPGFKKGAQSGRETDYEVRTSPASQPPVHAEITDKSGKMLAMKKSTFDLLEKEEYYSTRFRNLKNYNFSVGILTVPFKLRPMIDTINTGISTDVTLGPYLGITKRISHSRRYYITIPATLGLTYININNNNTSNVSNIDEINVVPGISWSSGLIFQLSDFNAGIVFGIDYASGIGDKWVYNKRMWYSFAIGYSMLKE